MAIALKNKWGDPFFKSEVNVILLQVIFAIVLLLLTYLFFNYFYREIIETIVSSLMESILTGEISSGESLVNTIEGVKIQNFGLFTTILLAVTVLFAFLVAKITLKPAKTALHSQKRFISDIAHELRTPLSVVKTNNEVALMDKNLDEKVKEMVESNIEELDRMSQIINNILSFSSLVTPDRIKFINVDLGPVIDSSVNKLKALAEKKRLEITVKKVAPHIVYGNAVALEQIVSNLLKNAINYTPNGGRVTIRVGPDYYGNVVVQIEDTGEGINKNDLMHIFEPFFRTLKSRTRQLGSTGLGLTIVSELVKIHSGRITVKSAENKGTVAIVTLPYAKNLGTQESIDISRLNEVSINFLKGKK